MNIMNKLTWRFLKENKKRTIVTIIGVAISVAMLTAVSTLGTSFMGLMQGEEIATNGDWHVLYNEVDQEQLEGIQNDENTESVILSRDDGYAYLEDSENDHKPYLFVREYNTEGFEHFPITLLEGEMPINSDELVISEHIASNANVEYQIGDSIILDIGERTIASEDWENLNPGQSNFLKDDETLENTDERSFTIISNAPYLYLM